MINRGISRIIALFMLVSLTFSFSAAATSLTVNWNETYGGATFTSANQLIQTNDGGYALIGAQAQSQSLYAKDIWLVKIDQNGTEQWNETCGGVFEDEGNDILQNDDGGYTIVGYRSSADETHHYDLLLIRTNATGNLTWQKTSGGPGNEQGVALIQTSEGDYVIAGISDFGEETSGIIVLKTDDEGELIWVRTFSGPAIDKARDVIKTQDGGFAVVGETSSYGAGGYDCWLIKIDSNGTMEWNRTYGGKHDDIARSLLQTSDGGFLLAGGTRSYGSGSNDCWLVKTDSNGFMEWNQTFGGKEEDFATSVIQTNDGGFALAGCTHRLFYYDFYVVKTDANGYLQWSETVSGDGDFCAQALVQTLDEKYVVAGYIQFPLYFNILAMEMNATSTTQSNLYPLAAAGGDVDIVTGESLSFSTSESYDPDGTIVSYQWDFEGNGVYDWNSPTSETTSYAYLAEGTFQALLKVTDNNGSSSTDMRTIVVTSAQQPTTGNLWIIFILLFISAVFFSFVLLFDTTIKQKMKHITILTKFTQDKFWLSPIVLGFLLIFIIKLIVSFFFHMPWVHFDEHSYGVIAGDIAAGNLSLFGGTTFADPYPSGYSYFLAPAYALSNNMDVVYHIMLGINVLLTTLLMFPVYFIMKRFVDKKLSLATAILASILPPVLIYNYLLLSESVLYLLFILSCFLIVKTFTYEHLDRRFVIYSLSLGACIGLLLTVKATGIAMLLAILCVLIYKFYKTRSRSSIKYGLIFLPFLPFIAYLMLNPSFASRYSFSFYLTRLSQVFSSTTDVVNFFQVILSEINYFVVMSILVFLAFTFFLFFHRKHIPMKQRKELSVFMLYSFVTVFLLIILTSLHMSYTTFSIYTRYVSVGLFPIIMLGVIGMNLYLTIKNKKAKFHLGNICVLLGFFFIFLFPLEQYNLVNNLDIFWITSLHNASFFGLSGFMLLQIVLGLLLVYTFISLNIKYFSKKNLRFIFKPAKHGIFFIVLALLLSPLMYFPGGAERSLYEETSMRDMHILEPVQWLKNNDPEATLLMEDSTAAYLGGGMEPAYWLYMFANLEFWVPRSDITLVNRSQLRKQVVNKDIESNYILSTHDLTSVYPSVADFSLNIPVSSHLKQDTVDWHLYQVQ